MCACVCLWYPVQFDGDPLQLKNAGRPGFRNDMHAYKTAVEVEGNKTSLNERRLGAILEEMVWETKQFTRDVAAAWWRRQREMQQAAVERIRLEVSSRMRAQTDLLRSILESAMGTLHVDLQPPSGMLVVLDKSFTDLNNADPRYHIPMATGSLTMGATDTAATETQSNRRGSVQSDNDTRSQPATVDTEGHTEGHTVDGAAGADENQAQQAAVPVHVRVPLAQMLVKAGFSHRAIGAVVAAVRTVTSARTVNIMAGTEGDGPHGTESSLEAYAVVRSVRHGIACCVSYTHKQAGFIQGRRLVCSRCVCGTLCLWPGNTRLAPGGCGTPRSADESSASAQGHNLTLYEKRGGPNHALWWPRAGRDSGQVEKEEKEGQARRPPGDCIEHQRIQATSLLAPQFAVVH